MDQIEQDVKDIKKELKEINATLLRNTVSLEIHERRCTLLEKRQDGVDMDRRWLIGLIVSALVTFALKLAFH